MNIKPIKTKNKYKLALARIDELWGSNLDTPEGDELDILTILVEAYEQMHYEILPPDPIEAIKFRMEQMGLKNIDLVPIFGGRNRVSEVLNKKRSLTVKMIKALNKELKIPAESLIS